MGLRKSLKIVLLFDLSEPIPQERYADHWKDPDWRTESDVRNALARLGHQVIPLGLHDSLDPLLELLRKDKPDLVFNLSEAFRGDRDFEPHIVAALELLGVPVTGSGPMGLKLCKDKGLTKEILGYHRVRIPRFLTAKRGRPVASLRRFPFPAIIKPLRLESSEGISQLSFVENEKDAAARVKFIHERLGADAIVEEYIDGRELYVSVLGNEKLAVLPAREIFFHEVPKDEPKMATFRAKWDEDYRKKWGIQNGFARALPPSVAERLEETCKKIYRLLRIRGYGRIDLRVKENGEIYFIEANPNPSIGRHEDFALSAGKADLAYDDLIAKIVSLAT
ncbi:MAG: ATP-grasp domain-containing protein [Bdellovibrionales bacterium]|nr:ATP-grasp domain-containing protein [Bdellovibrionales bacterium]